MLSLNDEMLHRVTYRVGSSQKEFVVTMPVSPFMRDPKKSFYGHILEGLEKEEAEQKQKILSFHPKINARKIILRCEKKNCNIMEFRIPLQIKASLNFSNVSHNDPFFYGDKFIKYPDGSVHLHVELVEEKVEKNFQEKNGNSGTFLNVPGSISLDDDSTWLGDDDMSFETSRRSLRSSKSSRSRRSSKSSSSRLSASSGRRSLGGFSGGGHSIKS